MSGIYYLLSLIAFWVIVAWFMQNDQVRPGERTRGLLRMNDADLAASDTKSARRLLR